MLLPPIINISSSGNDNISLGDFNIVKCGKFKVLETIIFFLFGRGLPILSKVFLPITIVLFKVTFLKYFRSSGMCHGNWLFRPMT